MSNFRLLSTTHNEGVVSLVLNRPPVNALNRELIDELHLAFREIAAEPSAKVVVLSGAGKNFAAGADIKQIASLPEGPGVTEFSRAGMDCFLAIERLERPVIAAIRGFCLGGGNELAMACHMRIADPGASFGQPEVKLGICPGFGATQRLPQLVGRANALRMLTGGEPITAAEALRMGLADQVVAAGEDVVEVANAFARGIAAFSAPVLAAIMRATVTGCPTMGEEGKVLESQLFGDLSRIHDMKEGFRAFIEKRQPRFENR